MGAGVLTAPLLAALFLPCPFAFICGFVSLSGDLAGRPYRYRGGRSAARPYRALC